MVAHLTGGQGVAGSNPVAPTNKIAYLRDLPTDQFWFLQPFGSKYSVLVFIIQRFTDEEISKDVAYWENSFAIKLTWGNEATFEAIDWIDNRLGLINRFLHKHGMVHFDAHIRNIVMNKQEIFLGDFGLAMSRNFELMQEEKDFLDCHHNYDRAMTALSILHTVLTVIF